MHTSATARTAGRPTVVSVPGSGSPSEATGRAPVSTVRPPATTAATAAPTTNSPGTADRGGAGGAEAAGSTVAFAIRPG